MKISDKLDFLIGLPESIHRGEQSLKKVKNLEALKSFPTVALKEGTKIGQNMIEEVSSLVGDENGSSYIKEQEALIKELNRWFSSLNRALKVEIDDELRIPIFKIIDLETKEVVRQIPIEDILKFKKAFTQFLEKYGYLNSSEEKGNWEVSLKGLFLRKEV